MGKREDGYYWARLQGWPDWEIVQVGDGEVEACGYRRALGHTEISEWGPMLPDSPDVHEAIRRERDELIAHVEAWKSATGCRSPTQVRDYADALRRFASGCEQ